MTDHFQPSIYPPERVPMARYIADDLCEAPSLSPSRVTRLLNSTPRHALEHQSKHTRATLNGVCLHSLLAGDIESIHTVDAPSWARKAQPQDRKASLIRDELIEQGKIPVLVKDWDAAIKTIGACRKQIAEIPDCAGIFSDAGVWEHTLIWQEPNGVWCRCRPDWMQFAVASHAQRVADYKSTTGLAHPAVIERIADSHGWAMKAAMTMRGLSVLTGCDIEDTDFRFIVQETAPPHHLLPLQFPGEDISIALEQFALASAVWNDCIEREIWTAYPRQTMQICTPRWSRMRWAEMQRQIGADPAAYMKMLESGDVPLLTHEGDRD